MRRIRRVSVAPTKGSLFENAFVFDEDDEQLEVLLADDEHFEVIIFNKDSLVSTCGKYQIPHI
jgi:hypothetical protein